MVNIEKLQHKNITCQKGNFEEARVQTLKFWSVTHIHLLS